MSIDDDSATYSGFIKRALALLIDSLTLAVIVVGGVGGLLAMVARASPPQKPPSGSAVQGLQLIMFLGGLLYYPLFEGSSYQATPGKMAIGVKDTDMEGRPVGFLIALLRHLSKFLSALILNIGFFMAGFTEKKQALHDKITGCLVVDKS